MLGRLLLVGAILLALVPSASADASTVMLAFEDEERFLEENGRGKTKLVGTYQWANVVCANDMTLVAKLELESFPKWAGASLTETSLRWTVLRGETSGTKVSETVLDYAWDVESAPRVDAKHTYTAIVRSFTQEGGPCQSDSAPQAAGPASTTARLGDRPEPVADPCKEFDASACTTLPTISEAPPTPVPPVAALLALAAGVVVWRRRRA